jgi:hypothetical protein
LTYRFAYKFPGWIWFYHPAKRNDFGAGYEIPPGWSPVVDEAGRFPYSFGDFRLLLAGIASSGLISAASAQSVLQVERVLSRTDPPIPKPVSMLK